MMAISSPISNAAMADFDAMEMATIEGLPAIKLTTIKG